MGIFVKRYERMSADALKKEADETYNRKIARENSLVAAAESGILKSETLRREAAGLKKSKAKSAEKQVKKNGNGK